MIDVLQRSFERDMTLILRRHQQETDDSIRQIEIVMILPKMRHAEIFTVRLAPKKTSEQLREILSGEL